MNRKLAGVVIQTSFDAVCNEYEWHSFKAMPGFRICGKR
jgi:hypothetical protein